MDVGRRVEIEVFDAGAGVVSLVELVSGLARGDAQVEPGVVPFRGAEILYTLRLASGQKVLALVPSHHNHALGEKIGMPRMRIMTDFCGEQYWTIVAEMEVESLDGFMAMDMGAEAMKEFETIMQGYHDLIDHGRREIYRIEG